MSARSRRGEGPPPRLPSALGRWLAKVRTAVGLFAAITSVACRRAPPTGSTPASVEGVSAPALGAPASADRSPQAGGSPFPLRLSADRRYPVDASGAPFLVAGDAAWSLVAQLDDASADAYLEDRRRRGFNTIVVNLIEHQFADHAPADAYGHAPFTRPGDFDTPNEAYFAHADRVIAQAAKSGLLVLLAPDYLGYAGDDEGWFVETERSGEASMRRYGAYVGERYRAFDNVVWVLGGDYTPPPGRMGLVNALAEGIRSRDARHLFTAHWGQEMSSQDVTDPAWLTLGAPFAPISVFWSRDAACEVTLCVGLDLNATYTYRSVYAKSAADDARADRLPHFLMESTYEGEHDSKPSMIRAQAYEALLTGAAGQVVGNGEIWKFGPGWRDQLGSPGEAGASRASALFASRAWTKLVPDTAGLVVSTGGTSARDRTIAAAAVEETLVIAYVPDGRPVVVHTDRLAKPARARWYDPTSGAFVDVPVGVGQGGPWSPPGKNAAGDADWALVVEAL